MKSANPTKLGGYYRIPHELLHVAACKLLGKPYHYRIVLAGVMGYSHSCGKDLLDAIGWLFVYQWANIDKLCEKTNEITSF